MITIGRHLIRKVLNNYIYMISTTTIDKNKILTKNIISNNITCNGCLIFKYANENVSIGIHDPTTHGDIFNTYSGNSKNVASGKYSHAEGYGSMVSGDYSHAEGYYTSASGIYSHTHNYHTTADYNSMTAIGNYNISNTNEQVNNKKNKLFVVGNGNSSAAEDAFIVTETGDVFISGNLYINDKLYYNIGDTNWISNTYFDSIQ